MAGRGRGRGRAPVALGGDQPGFGKVEILPPVLQPPPKYPPLEYKAVSCAITNDDRYSLTLRSDFTEFMRESSNFVLPTVVKKDIERFSDRYERLSNDQHEYQLRYDWSRMPSELKPMMKKRKRAGESSSNKKKSLKVDVESVIRLLEQKEEKLGSDEDEEKEKEDETEDKDEMMEEVQEQDEEMDEGTDYVNNYFDNGEDYDEEDDNADDDGAY